jgi:hypothetical protein
MKPIPLWELIEEASRRWLANRQHNLQPTVIKACLASSQSQSTTKCQNPTRLAVAASSHRMTFVGNSSSFLKRLLGRKK